MVFPSMYPLKNFFSYKILSYSVSVFCLFRVPPGLGVKSPDALPAPFLRRGAKDPPRPLDLPPPFRRLIGFSSIFFPY